jgi:hypothetical protein
METAASTNASSSEEAAAKKKTERSLGQWAFDTIIYGGIINTTVFIASIAATYLTSYGRQFAGESKSLVASFARFMNGRGEYLDKKLLEKGWAKTPAAAEDMRMVAFSFLDGTVVSMLAKPLEALRNPIARFVDKKFSDKPVDEATYHNEPKQSWGSIFGGRLVTFAAVITTYFGLRSLHVKSGDSFKNMNEALFADPGKKLGQKLAGISWVKDNFPNLSNEKSIINLPGLFRVGLFEAFYTTLCTLGLYSVSRGLARLFGKESRESLMPPALAPQGVTASGESRGEAMLEVPVQKDTKSVEPLATVDKPQTRVHNIMQTDRQVTVTQSQLSGV